jgi:hypothetical protein
MFYITVWASDNVNNFLQHIQPAHFQMVLHIFLSSFLDHPELRKPVEKVAALIREVLPQQKSVFALASPLGSVLLISR